MDNQTAESTVWKSQNQKSIMKLAVWTGLWVITAAIAAFGPEMVWSGNVWISLVAIILNLAVGVRMIIVNMHHLRLQDELMQKIQLEAMGISLGVAVVSGITFSMLDASNIIPFDAEIGFLIMIMGITYLITVMINLKRYK